MSATWDHVLSAIAAKVPEATFERWFRPLRVQNASASEFTLATDDEFDAVFIERNFSELIRLHLERMLGTQVRVFVVHEPRSGLADRDDEAAPGADQVDPAVRIPVNGGTNGNRVEHIPQTLTERIIEAGLKSQYSFDQFVVGSGSEFAHAAAVAVSEQKGQVYNPLFIYGRVGLGKTHLINAVGIELLRRDPSCRVRYMTSEAFMNQLIEHLKSRDMAAFRARFRDNLDVLLIDDIQFIAGKEATQQEFFHTFNALHQTGAQIIITSDQYPHEIPKLEERLRSRFQWGLIADIQAPGIETRIAILRKKAENLELQLPDDVALFLAEHIRNNVRELEGALLRLHAFVGFNHQKLTLSLAKRLLQQFLQDRRAEVSVDKILKVVCHHFNLKLAEIKGKSRQRAVSHPRQVAMYLAKKHTSHSYPQLGGHFERDHTTVLAGFRKVSNRLEQDTALEATMRTLESALSR